MASSPSNRTAVGASLGFLAGAIGAALVLRTRRKALSDLQDAEIRSLLLEEDGEDCIYLDYNGTTPVYPEVVKAMMPFLTTHFGNPSSGHCLATVPRQAVDRAREQILYDLLEATRSTDLSSIWFTSCGTESDNLAIHLALQSTVGKFQSNGELPHIVTCNVEHPAVAGMLDVLVEQGRCKVSYVPVQTDGRVRAKDMIAAIQLNTVLVTLMLANNESGALQPVREVATYCRKQQILFHTDVAQAAGKVSVHLQQALGDADMVSLVGHKIGAPKGVACLYVRPGCFEEGGRKLHSHGVLLIGGGQEFGRRGGTENVPYIVGMGHAAVLAASKQRTNATYMESLRSRLLKNLEGELGSDRVKANGPVDPSLRLPNTLSVGIRDVHSGELLAAVADQVAASAGATCHSSAGVSSVLTAMKVPDVFARGTLRLSVGPTATVLEVDMASQILAREAKRQLGIEK